MVGKIRELCKERGISIQQLEKEIGLSNGTIGKWDNASPRISNLKKVCSFFNVPIKYFVEEEAEKNKPTTVSDGELPQDIQEIIRLYDAASPEVQNAALQLLRTLVPSDDHKENNDK